MNGHSTVFASAPTLRLVRSHSLEMPDSPPQTPIKTSPTHLYKALNGGSSMETLLETNYKNSLDQFSPTHFSKQWTESSIVMSTSSRKISSKAAYQSRSHNGSPTHHSRSQNVSPTHHSRSQNVSPTHYSRSQNVSPTHYSRSQNVSPTHHSRSQNVSPTHHSRSQNVSPTHHSRSQSVSPTHSIISQNSSSTRSQSPPAQNTTTVQQKTLDVTYKALSQSNTALDNFSQNGTAENEQIRPRSVSTPHRSLQRPKNLLSKMNGGVVTEDSVKDVVLNAISSLHGLSDFANQEAKMLVKTIGDCYWKNTDKRQHIADVFASNGGAELMVRILKSLSKEGLFKSDSVWFTAYYVYNAVWNLSDSSILLAQHLGDAGIIQLCVANVDHKPYKENMAQKNIAFLIRASLSILHNLAKVPGNRHYFREEQVVDKVQELSQSSEKYLQAITMMTLAYIIEDEHTYKLEEIGDNNNKAEETDGQISESGAIEYIVGLLREAVEDKERRCQGLSCAELAQGLGRLAVCDRNKSKIFQAGSLQLLLCMLEEDNLEEQTAAAQAIWTLSFDESVRQSMIKDESCIHALKKASQNEHEQVNTAAKGALWIIQRTSTNKRGRRRWSSRTSTSSSNFSCDRPHIMISYQWHYQKRALKIRDMLTNAGFRVWVDVDCMYGSTLQAMAEAVENAAAVLICMSERYKDSPNCRTEAEYAFQLRKKIVPLMMEEFYVPDGWLGIILGTKYYMDFSGRLRFEDEALKLINEISDCSHATVDEEDEVIVEEEPIIIPTEAHFDSAPPGVVASAPSVRDWNREQVAQWLEATGLTSYRTTLAEFDGKLLAQLQCLRREAPEFFYATLKQELGFRRIVDILKFTEAMDCIL